MFKVLKIDGPNLTTDLGCVLLTGVQYADGGKSHPVSDVDWRRMRTLFIAAPDLLAAAERALVELCARQEDLRPDEVIPLLRAAIAKARGE